MNIKPFLIWKKFLFLFRKSRQLLVSAFKLFEFAFHIAEMNFINKIPLVAILILLNIIIPTVSPLSLQNQDLRKASPRFVYGAAGARNEPNPEIKSLEDEDTLVLYKEDGPENLWCTAKGDIVKIVVLEKSELEKLEAPQFHEPSFLREKDSHELCKRKHVQDNVPSQEASGPYAKKEAELTQKINQSERKTKRMPLVKVSEHSYQSINDKARIFGLFGPPTPPPFFGPPAPYYDPYFDGPPPPYYGGSPGPYYNEPYYPPYGPGPGFW